MRGKLKYLILILVIAFVMIQVTTMAYGFSINATTSNSELKVGENVNYVISFDSNVITTDFEITYDSSKLEFVKALTENVQVNDVKKENKLKILYADETGIGTKEIIVEFKAKDVGENLDLSVSNVSAFSVESKQAYDEKFGTITTLAADKVTIKLEQNSNSSKDTNSTKQENTIKDSNTTSQNSNNTLKENNNVSSNNVSPSQNNTALEKSETTTKDSTKTVTNSSSNVVKNSNTIKEKSVTSNTIQAVVGNVLSKELPYTGIKVNSIVKLIWIILVFFIVKMFYNKINSKNDNNKKGPKIMSFIIFALVLANMNNVDASNNLDIKFYNKVMGYKNIAIVVPKEANQISEDYKTGTKINKDGKEYTVLAYGDVNGDGAVNSNDIAEIIVYRLGNKELTGIYKEAANVKNLENDIIDSNDIARIKDFILGINSESLVEKIPEEDSTQNNVTNEIVDVTIKKLPNKLSYIKGEELDLTGGELTITYQNKETINIDMSGNKIVVNGYDKNNIGLQELTFSYAGKELSFEVEVRNNLVKLAITKLPSKTVYIKGQDLDLADGEVLATYENKETKTYSLSDLEIIGYNKDKIGEQSLVVKCENVEKKFKVVVKNDISNIYIKTSPSKLEYIKGEDLSFNDGILEVTYEDGTKEEIAFSNEAVKIEGYDKNSVKSQYVKIKYKNKEISITVNVIDVVEKIEISSLPEKTIYCYQEKFNSDGLVVKAIMQSKEEKIVNDYQISIKNDEVLNELGKHIVKVNYHDKEATFEITVNDISKSIQITSLPEKVEYKYGEKFVTKGLVVTSENLSGTVTEITDYSLNIKDGQELTRLNKNEVIINYQNQSESFDINVSDFIETIEVTKKPNKTEYKYGENFNSEGMEVTAKYASGKKEKVTDYTLDTSSEYVFNNYEPKKVTVNYCEVTTTFEVKVKNSIEGIELTVLPGNMKYYYGDKFSTEGIIVRAVYAKGNTEIVKAYQTSIEEGTELNELGTKTVKVKYQGYAQTFDINVVDYIKTIEITKLPKTDYYYGEGFSSEGLELLATYATGKKEIITDYSIDLENGAQLNSIGDKRVTISVSDRYVLKTTFDINVINYATAIEITSLPTRLNFNYGEECNYTGLCVQAIYANGNMLPISSDDYEIEPGEGFVLEKLGKQEVVITFEDRNILTTSFEINVVDVIESLTITKMPTKVNYIVGEKFTLEGIEITATYLSGATKVITDFESDIEEGTVLETVGTFDVSINYEESDENNSLEEFVSFQIKVTNPIVNISIKNLPTKVRYLRLEELDLTGGQIYINYTAGDPDVLDLLDPQVSVSGFDIERTGTQNLVAKYQEFECNFDVEVYDNVSKIEIIQKPDRNNYAVNELLDLNGMKVLATYESGYSEEVVDYTTTPSAGSKLQTLGTQKVEVLYEGAMAEFIVTVDDFVSAIHIEKEPDKVIYSCGENLDLTGIVVKAQYESGATASVTDFTSSIANGSPCTTLGIQAIEINYLGKTASFNIEVKNAVEKIEIVNPTKLSYKYGERLDLSGLEVTATYSDLTTANVTDYEISLPNNSELNFIGDKKVEITYHGKTASFTVTVTDDMSGIQIEEYPTKMSYSVGESLDLSGIKVSTVSRSGVTHEITDYVAEPINGTVLNTIGTQTVTIKYKEYSESFDITIIKEVVDISISQMPTKLNYLRNEKIDLSGGKLRVNYTTGENEIIDLTNKGVTVSGYDSTQLKNQRVNINYGGRSTQIDVTVYDNFNNIEVATLPNKVIYEVGESLDYTGLVVKAVYESGYKEEITDYTITPNKGALLANVGTVSVSVNYNGKTTSFDVIVKDIVSAIAIQSNPNKTTYIYGEKLNLDGLVVNVIYASGRQEVITNYVVTPSNETVLDTLGPQFVTVEYEGKTAQFPITVNDMVTSLEILSNPNKTEYNYLEKLDLTGLTVRANYVSGANPVITNYTVSMTHGTELNKIGKHTITVTFKEKTAKFTINVVDLAPTISITSSEDLSNEEDHVLLAGDSTPTTYTITANDTNLSSIDISKLSLRSYRTENDIKIYDDMPVKKVSTFSSNPTGTEYIVSKKDSKTATIKVKTKNSVSTVGHLIVVASSGFATDSNNNTSEGKTRYDYVASLQTTTAADTSSTTGGTISTTVGVANSFYVKNYDFELLKGNSTVTKESGKTTNERVFTGLNLDTTYGIKVKIEFYAGKNTDTTKTGYIETTKKTAVSNGVKVYFIDVSEDPTATNDKSSADAIFIITENNKYILIDSGNSGSSSSNNKNGGQVISDYLQKTLKITTKSIDYYISTHYDGDHIGGFNTLLKNGYSFKNVVVSCNIADYSHDKVGDKYRLYYDENKDGKYNSGEYYRYTKATVINRLYGDGSSSSDSLTGILYYAKHKSNLISVTAGNSIKVDTCILNVFNPYPDKDLPSEFLESVVNSDAEETGSIRLGALYPKAARSGALNSQGNYALGTHTTQNNQSVVIKLICGSRKMLLTGDAEFLAEEVLLGNVAKEINDNQVYSFAMPNITSYPIGIKTFTSAENSYSLSSSTRGKTYGYVGSSGLVVDASNGYAQLDNYTVKTVLNLVQDVIRSDSSIKTTADVEAKYKFSRLTEKDLSAQVLKKGHHGGYNTTSVSWLEKVKPNKIVTTGCAKYSYSIIAGTDHGSDYRIRLYYKSNKNGSTYDNLHQDGVGLTKLSQTALNAASAAQKEQQWYYSVFHANGTGKTALLITTSNGTGWSYSSATNTMTSVYAGVQVTKTDLPETLSLTTEKGSLSFAVYPRNSTDVTVSWKSSDTGIVTVSGDTKINSTGVSIGTLTAKKNGTVNVTATVKDANGKTFSSTCKVTVKLSATTTPTPTPTPNPTPTPVKTVKRKVMGKTMTLPEGDKFYFLEVDVNGSTGNKTKLTKWADCIIIESNGKFGMVDLYRRGDNHFKAVKQFVKDLGIQELEFILISHEHVDHRGNLELLLNDKELNLKVNKLYIKNGTKNNVKSSYYSADIKAADKKNVDIKYVSKKENTTIQLGNLKFDLYNRALVPTTDDGHENGNSITALATSYKGKTVYLAGDIQKTTVNGKTYNSGLDAAKEIGKQIDVYKVAHHGQAGANNLQSELNILKPKYAIMTIDSDQKDTTARLKVANSKVKIYRTGIHNEGTVVVNIDPNGEITIKGTK